MTPQEQPDSQDKLIDFIKDLETTNKAVEGSMDKRLAAMDSQAGDEQTETDELKRIITDAMSKVYGYESYSDLCRYDADTNVWSIASNIVREADAAVVTLEAWSRQQTAQVLTELKRRHQMPLTHPYLTSNGSLEILAVPVVYIDEKLAAIAALRVGLEGKHDD